MAGTRTRKSPSAAEIVAQTEPQPAPEMEEAVARDATLPSGAFRFEAWPTEHRIVTQWFGTRPEFYRKYGLPGHEGVDFAAPLGSKIFAVAPGTVKRVQATDDGKAYGIHVRIGHADGYETIYGHFKTAVVKVGDEVAAGQLIGYSDSTGNSFGSHLHLTLKHATETLGRYPNHIVDPTPFVKTLLEQGKDGAAYVKDVIPDGTKFEAGAGFVQQWTLRNSGTSAWGDGYTLAYLSGERLGAPASVPVPATAPGGLAEIAVTFQAPAAPGKYRSVWQMRAPARPGGIPAARFGERVWVEIVVPAVVEEAQPKGLFEEVAEQPPAEVVVSMYTDTLTDLIMAFEGIGADEIQALLAGLPLLAGLEVILRGHAVQLQQVATVEQDALTERALDQIVALQKRMSESR